MTRKEAIEKLKDIQASTDTEMAHILADNILCELLKDLGYKDVVKQYDKIRKWFA